MRLRSIRAHGLTNFQFSEFADHARTGQQTQQQGRARSHHGTQGEVAEDVEGADVLRQPLEEFE